MSGFYHEKHPDVEENLEENPDAYQNAKCGEIWKYKTKKNSKFG